MSLLKWKELAKRKTELGNKINYAHNTITQHKIGQETSQQSFEKVFKPITSKLDDVVVSNLTSRMPPQRNQPPKKDDPEIDYAPEVDPYEDMDVEGLINMGDYVPPQKDDYVPPQKDEDIITASDEDVIAAFFNNISLPSYEDIKDKLNQPEMTNARKSKYINNTIVDAMFRRNQMNGYKTDVIKKYFRGEITESEKNESAKKIDNIRHILNEYIAYIKKNYHQKKGKGIKQRGGSVIFFNDPKQLLKKLELIIGEVCSR